MKFNVWTISTIVFLILFLYQWNCKGVRKCPECETKTKVIYHSIHDTVPGKEKIVVKREVTREPGKIVDHVVYRDGKTDTIFKPADTAKILNDYYVIRDYEETYETKFKIGTAEGTAKVTIPSQVSENKLNQQNAIFDLTIPEVQTTVVKKRAVLLLGVDLYGNPDNVLNGIGGNLALKTKGNKMYQAGVVKLDPIPLQYTVGFKMPLSLKKRQ